MKRRISILFIISILSLTTGCWNNRDLTELAIVSGIALDKLDNGKIELTVQVIKPSAIQKDGNSGQASKAYVNVTEDGSTVFEAVRNLITELDRKGFFAQTQVMVISEAIAKEDISEVVDFFERDHETKRRAELIIARGMKAKDVLEIESQIEKVPSIYIVESLKTSTAVSKARKINLLQLLKDFNNEGYAIVIPTIRSENKTGEIRQEDMTIEGSAIIKKDKLVGYLTPVETRGFMFADNKLKSTIIVVPGIKDPEHLISIEVVRSRGKVDAKIVDGKPELSIEIKAEGNIGAQRDHIDLTKVELTEALERDVEDAIKKEIEDVVRVTQKKYKSDIFGFINELYKNYYPQWKLIVKDWDEIYSNTPVEIKVDFEIRRSGLVKEPTEPK